MTHNHHPVNPPLRGTCRAVSFANACAFSLASPPLDHYTQTRDQLPSIPYFDAHDSNAVARCFFWLYPNALRSVLPADNGHEEQTQHDLLMLFILSAPWRARSAWKGS
jgi:hypothetical protein